MTLSTAAAALHQASDRLREPLAISDPGPAAFGADGPGGLGEVGQRLLRVWQRALATRDAEAAAHAHRLDELATNTARAAAAYAEVDDGAGGRLPSPEAS